MTPPTSPKHPEIAGYRITRELGRGGFGIVFHAVDENDRPVALKVAARGAGTSHLHRELETLHALGAPLAPQVFASGDWAEGTWAAIEFLPGETLAQRLTRSPPGLPIDDVRRLATSLLEALQRIHEKGRLHLDLKPENAVLHADGTARWIDFGSALPLETAAMGGRIAGSVEFMSPEQCNGRPLDVRSEVYSAASLILSALTGRGPFEGPELEVMQAHRALRPPRPSALALVNSAVDSVFTRAWAKDPEERFPDVASLLRALLATLQPASAKTLVVSAPASATSTPKRSMALLFLTGTKDPAALNAVLAKSGGILAHSAGPHAVAVFDPEFVENPARRALQSAEGIVGSGLAIAARVDVGPVSAQRRADGGLRYVTPLFGKSERFPTEPGVTTTDQAATLSPALFGRESVLTRVVALGSQAILGRKPTLLTMCGEAGVGKTALAAALVERVQQAIPQARVLHLHAREEGGRDELMAAVLRRALGVEPRLLDSVVARSALSVAVGEATALAHFSAVALSMGWQTPEDPAVQELLRVPGAVAAGLTRVVAEFLRREPTVVVIDDAHFASSVFLDALELAALQEDRAPIFGCVVARPSFRPARPLFGARAEVSEVEVLGPLEFADSERLVTELLRPAELVPPAVVTRLVERTRGIPLLMVELLRGLKADGLLRRATRGDNFYVSTEVIDRLPALPALEWIARHEVKALPPNLQAHAQLVALLGSAVSTPEVEEVLLVLEDRGQGRHFPLDASAGLLELLETGVLVSEGECAFHFRQAVVRDAVVETLAPELRAAVHSAAAEAYARPRLSGVEFLHRRARHLAASGARAHAAPIFASLGQTALESHRYLEATQCFEEALACLPADARAERLKAARGRGRASYRLGHYDASRTDLALARALAHELNDRRTELEVLLEEATALDWMTDYPASAARVTEARALADGDLPAELEAKLLMGEGRSHWRMRRLEWAAKDLEAAYAHATDYETRVATLSMLVSTLPNLGLLDRAAAILAELTTLVESHRDRAHLPAVYGNARLLLVARGQHEEALESQRRALAVCRESGIFFNEYSSYFNLAELHYQLAQYDEARSAAERAVAMETKYPDATGRPVGRLLLARIEACAGNEERARRLIDEMRELMATARSAGRTDGELLPNEQGLFDVIVHFLGESSSPVWLTILERARTTAAEHEPVELEELHLRAALRAGRIDEAREAFRRAEQALSQCVNMMGNRVAAFRSRL